MSDNPTLDNTLTIVDTRDEQEISKLSEIEGIIELSANWKPITYIIKFTFDGSIYTYEQKIEYDKKN